MKKYTLFALFAFVAVSHATAQLALDDQNILKARKAVYVSHNCDEALIYLRLVSDSGKVRQDYFLTVANANDCKSNNEQAIYYYSKFLDKNQGNDSVKKRLAELKDASAQKGTATKQEKNAKEIYKNAKKGFNGPCVNEKDFTWGLSCDIFTGGTSTPYKRAYNFFNNYEFPFAKNHMLFQFSEYLGYMTGGQATWFAQTFNTTLADVTKVPRTIQAGLDLSFAVFFVNKHSFAVSAGPLIGFNAYLMPGVDMTATSNEYSHPIMFYPVAGLRSNLFMGKHLYFSVAYALSLKSGYSNDLQSGITTVTPISGNTLTIGLGVRGFGFPRYNRGF